MNTLGRDPGQPGPAARRIADLTQGFTGRVWLFDQVEAFLKREEEPILIILGEPGAGKSAFAARLTQLRSIDAHHFCSVRAGGSLDPVRFAVSLAEQLATRLSGFIEALLTPAQPGQAQQFIIIQDRLIVAEHGNVTGIRVTIQLDVAQVPSPRQIFQRLVREPLHAWCDHHPGQPVVVLVDGLDEAAALEQQPTIVDLIASSGDLPHSVFWIVTSRPGRHLDTLAGSGQIVIEDQAIGNLDDIRDYAAKELADLSLAHVLPEQANVYADALARRSEGNFLYLRLVLENLRADAKAGRPLSRPTQLPRGLAGVYPEFLHRLLLHHPLNAWPDRFRPVFGALAVAAEALTFDQLIALSNVAPQTLRLCQRITCPF